MALAKQDEGTKKKTNTQTVTVGGRTVNVPATNTPTTKQTVSVGGRDIKVDVPTPNYSKPKTSAPSNPTVGGRTITQKNAPVVSSNVDLTPSIKQNNRTPDVAVPNFQAKQDYTKDDVNKIRDDFQNTLINSPFTNPDVEYTGQNYQQFDQDIKNKQAELKTAEGKVALNKEIQDTNKQGDLTLNDVVEEVNGKTQLIDYGTQIAQKEEENAQLEAELKELESQATRQPLNKIGAVNTSNLGMRMNQIRDRLNASNEELAELNRRSKYQRAVYGQFAYEDAVNKGDTDTLLAISDEHRSYDDNWLERRMTSLGKTSVDAVSTVVNVAQIGMDLGGQVIADAWVKGAEEMKENGTISDDQFNKMMETVKPLMDYDANDESTLGRQLRDISNQLSYDIQNGVDTSTVQGKILNFIGQGLDSTTNFLAQYMLFGEAGSLALMSGQSGSEKYFENLENGYDQYTAFANGLATGMTSYFVEKIGMDNFVSILNGDVGNSIFANAWNAIAGGKSPLSFWANATLSQGLSEGLEEGVEGTIDYLLDNFTAQLTGGEPVEYNPGDIFYSMLVGGFSGALTGASASLNVTINTRKQYNALKADVDSLISARDSALAKGQDVTLANRAIEVGQALLDNYQANTLTMAVELASDMAEPNPNAQGINEILSTILDPNVSQDIKVQGETNELIRNVMETAQTVMQTKGINMDAEEYVNLTPEARDNTTKVQDYANKLRANIMFSTKIDGDGYFDPKTGMIVVNPNSDLAQVSTLVHELTHGTESSGVFYDTLAKLVRENYGTEEEYKNAIANVKKFYRNTGVNLNNDGAKREFTAINTQSMLGNEEFVKRLVRYNESLAYRIFSDVRSMFSSDAKTNIENAFMQAFRANNTINTGSLAFSKGFTPSDLKEDVDNGGRELSKGQEEYFEGSKLVNEDGNLLRIYHTSDALFSVFDPTGTDHYRFGDKVVNYFSNNETVSGSYANNDYVQIADREYIDRSDELKQEIENLRKEAGEKYKERTRVIFGLEKQARTAVNESNILETANKIWKNIKGANVFSQNDKPLLADTGAGWNPVVQEHLLSLTASILDNHTNPMSKITTIRELADLATKKQFYHFKATQELADMVSPVMDIDLLPFSRIINTYESETKRLEQERIDILNKIDELNASFDNKGKQYVGYGKAVNPYVIQNESGIIANWNSLNDSDWKMSPIEFETVSEEIGGALEKLTEENLNSLNTKNRVNRFILDSVNDTTRKYLSENPIALANYSNIIKREIASVKAGFGTIAELAEDFKHGYSQTDGFAFATDDADENVYFTGRLETNDVVKAVLAINDYLDTPYDGVVFKNITDSASSEAQNIDSDIIALFEPNQFKLLENENPTESSDIRWSKGMALNDLREEAYYDTGNVDVDTLMNDIVDSMSEEELRRFLDEGEFTYATPEEVEDDPAVQEEGLWVKEPEGDYIKIDDDYVSNGKTVAWKDERIDAMIEENEKGNFAFSGHDPYQYHYAIKLSPKEYEALSYLFDPRHNEVWRDEVATQPENYGNGEVTPEKLGGWAKHYDDSNDPRRYRYKRKIDYMFFDAEYENGVLKIKEQEGNHRALILENSGYESMPVLLGTGTKLRGPIQLAGMNAGDIKNPNVKLFSSGEYVELISKNRDELIRRFGSGANADIQYSKGMTAKMLAQSNKNENNAETEKISKEDKELIKRAVKELNTVKDSTRKANTKAEVSQALNEINENGSITSATLEQLRKKVIESTLTRVPNDNYEIAKIIRQEMGWSSLPKKDWDVVLQTINDRFSIIPDGQYPTGYQDAKELVDNYLADVGGKYNYLSPVEQGWITAEEYERTIDDAIKNATDVLKYGSTEQDIAGSIINEVSDYLDGTDEFMERLAEQAGYESVQNVQDENDSVPLEELTALSEYGNIEERNRHEFRILQEIGQDLLRKSGRDGVWDSEERYRLLENAGVRKRVSEILKSELQSRGYSDSNSDGLLKNTGDFKIFKDVDGQVFHDIFSVAQLYTPLGELVDLHSVDTVEHEGWKEIGYKKTRNFISEDGMSGFAIEPDGNLISVFNASGKPGFLSSIASFVKENAKKCDCYILDPKYTGTNLVELYNKYFGFEVDHIEEYNVEEYGDEKGIARRYENPPIAYMVNPRFTATQENQTDGDLNLTDEDLKNYRVIDSATTEKYGKKNIDKETGILKPKAIIELDTTIGKTTHEEEIKDGEEYAGKFAQELDNGADVDDLLQKLMSNELQNGIVRAYYVSQVLADRSMQSEYMELAQWARDIGNLGGKLVESNKILYDLDSTFSKAVYLTQVEENLKSEYKEHLKNKKGVDVEQTISEIFNEYANKIINSKTSREFRSAIGALTREVNRRMPKTIWDRIHQYRMLAMLSGTKTAVSNFVSNTFSLGLYKMNSMNQALLESAMQNVEIKSFDDKKTYQIKQEDRNATLRKDSTATKRNRKLATEIWDSLGENEKTKYGIETEKIPDIIKNNLKIKNETTQSKLSKAVGGLFDTVQNVQGVLLNDAPFAKVAFVQKFDELARARGINTDKINKSSKEYARLIDDAYNYAQEVVSHNDTDISKTIANLTRKSASNVRINEDSTLVGLDKQIKRFKERANNGEPIYRFIDSAVSKLQKWFVPFYKTNASLLQKSLQFSPLEWGQVINDWGKVKAGRMEVVDMVEHMSKAVTGTELYLVGAIFGFLGLLKWEKDDEDYSGRLSIKIPGTDKGYTVDFIDPISTIFAKGVVLAQNISEQGGPFKTIEGLVRDYEDIFLSDELDMFSSMKDFFDTVGKVRKGKDDYGEYTLGDGATDIAFSVLNSYIPSIVRDVSRMIDPAKKNVYDTDNKKYLFNRLVNSTPFRTSLVDKKDATGRTINYTQPFTGNDVFDRILTQMVSRGKLVDSNGQAITTRSGSQNMQATSSDGYTQMAKDFQYKDENGDGFSDAHWIRDSVPSNIYPAGVQTELTPKEKETYGKTWTDTWTSGANYLADNDIYKGLSYENQADVIYELQGFARECIEADYCMANDLEMTEAQRTANEIRNFCTVDGKLDGKMLGLIALGTAKENKLASGGQRYVMAEQDEEGKTIRNSRQLAMRHIYEEAGIYDKIVEAVQNSDGALTYADFGLGKTVVEKYSDEKAGSDYQTIYNKTMKSSSKKSSKVSGGSAGGITKAKGGGSTKKLSMAPNPIKETKVANSYLKAYADVFKRNSSKATSSSSGTVICPKCGNRVSSGLSRCPICGTSL